MHEDPLEPLKSSWQKNEDCPSSEELTAFHEKSLEAEAMSRIRNHVARCGLCDLAITSLKDFDNSSAPAKQAEFRFSFRFLLNPVFAYLLVFVLLGVAYVGVFTKSKPAARPTTQNEPSPISPGVWGSARMFNLGEAIPQRGPQAGGVHEIALGPKEALFILNFYLPVRSDHSYKMEIRSKNGELVVASHEIQAGDTIGNFSIVAARSLLSDGDYRMLITESEKSSNQPIDLYEFLLRIK